MAPGRWLRRALVAAAVVACASAPAAGYVTIDGGAFVSVLPQSALADVAVPVDIASV